MYFVDILIDKKLTLSDLKNDYEEAREEYPESYPDDFRTQLREIILATINGRNELIIVGPTPKETEQFVKRLGYKPRNESRVEKDIHECFHEDGSFDWDKFQYFCDIAEYWDMDE